MSTDVFPCGTSYLLLRGKLGRNGTLLHKQFCPLAKGSVSQPFRVKFLTLNVYAHVSPALIQDNLCSLDRRWGEDGYGEKTRIVETHYT